MLKDIQLRQNNLHIINDNTRKISPKRENNNNKSRTKNSSIQISKENQETSFNDNANIGKKKLSKVNSYSKQVWENNKKEIENNNKIKKGKSTTNLKILKKINKNINSIPRKRSYHFKKHSLSKSKNNTNANVDNSNTNNEKEKQNNKKNNLSMNNIPTTNTENYLFTLNANNTNNTNENINTNANNSKTNITSIPNENINKEQKNNNLALGNVGEKSQNVKVFIRFRPSNELETSLLQNNYGWLVPKFISQNQLGIYTKDAYKYNIPNKEIPNNYIFSYDKVFSPNSNQSEIYTNVGKRIVEDIMAGYNGTIFAYGQSGSGKTYTMYGNDIFDETTKEIIPRVVEEIFKKIEKSDRNIDFQIKLSVMEIYKEVMYDLFTNENNLKIIENKEKGIYIENLSEIYLSSIEEFFNYTELAQKNRKVAETKLNHNSSRSHCIMILEVVQNCKKEKIIKKGILNLVDLAGSEKVSKTGAVGETLEEAKKINLSLSTLGNVIHALTQGMGHVPFRDSKLTRILKESLGGNYKTYLIVTCSPHSYNLDEIISSLLFAKRVKCIKNKYKINIKYSYEELQNLVDKLNEKLSLANEKIYKLIKGEKITLNEDKKRKTRGKSSFSCNNCDLISKEKKILEIKIQELMENIQEKETEISKLKEEIQNLKKNKNIKDNNLKEIQEVNEENKKDELLELYKKIKEQLSKIEEENNYLKIIQNEEEEIRKINLKKESFNKIIQEFIKNKDKINCFEKMDNITKVSIPYVKDKDYKKLFNEYKNNINNIFSETFINNNNNNNNNSLTTKKNLDIITTNLFFEYMHFYFSQQIINQGYLKLILDNNSLLKMNKLLFDIVRDVLTENMDIANENAINANAINYLRASIADSFISKPGNNNMININDINQKIIKNVSKKNLNLKNSLRISTLNNIFHDNTNNASIAGSIHGVDLRNSFINLGNDNYAAYVNKLKSKEFEKSNDKIQMIRNVLVTIIKETDYIRNNIKDLKENVNITIINIMNYFSQKIFNNDSNKLDIKDNNVYEKAEIDLSNKENIELSNNNNVDNNLNLIYKSDINNNKTKKIIKVVQNKKNITNIINDNDCQTENLNPNIIIKKNNTIMTNNNLMKNRNYSQFSILTANPSYSNLNDNNKKSCFYNNAESGTASRKFDTLAPVQKKLNQAKGDTIDNANYFTLTQS